LCLSWDVPVQVIPKQVAELPFLEVLNVSGNRLSSLHPVGAIPTLRELSADANLLSTVPAEISQCTLLESLSLENNKLAAPLLDLRLGNTESKQHQEWVLKCL
jgi:Leucine-rich repeat (LRR) protein